MRTPAEETAPQQTTEVVETQPQTAMEIAMVPYMSEVNSISQQMDDLQKQHDEVRAEEESRLQKMHEARQKGMSLFGTLVEKQKPVYDENKEKRMRNAAIIQSLGDVLSAAARGYFAYNKKGAGVVPKAPMSNAFEGVQKINEMQNKYLNEKKAWDALDLQWKRQQADADAEAAEALYTSAKEARKEISKRIDELRERGITITDKVKDMVATQVMEEYNDQREIEQEKELALWEKANGIGQSSSRGRRSSGGGGSKTIKQSDKAKIYARLKGDFANEGDTWNKRTDQEQKNYNQIAENDDMTNLITLLIEEGWDFETAVESLEHAINAEGNIEQLVASYESSLPYVSSFGDYIKKLSDAYIDVEEERKFYKELANQKDDRNWLQKLFG